MNSFEEKINKQPWGSIPISSRNVFSLPTKCGVDVDTLMSQKSLKIQDLFY
jgi:hypothetical protein